MRNDEVFELGDDWSVQAQRELGIDPQLERGQPELLEPRDLELRERLIGEVCERRSAPERDRVGQCSCRGCRISFGEQFSPLGKQPLETVKVELVAGN